MPFKFTRKREKAAHWFRVPAMRADELHVKLPQVLDGINCRLVRKMVLTRLMEAQAIYFDAIALERLGGVGAATLLQIMRVAEQHRVSVTITNVEETIREKLFVMIAAERRRQTSVGQHSDPLAAIVLSDVCDQGRSQVHLPALPSISGRHKAA